MLKGEFTRELDPAEIYYELIDRTWSMNALCVAEFDVALSADQVEKAWDKLAEQIPIIDAHVERTSGRDARIVFGTSHQARSITCYDDASSACASESRKAFDLTVGPMVRCSLVERESDASVVFASHHSALDGRSLIDLAVLFANVVIDGADVSDHPLSEPTVALRSVNDAGSVTARTLVEVVGLARKARAEDDFVGAAESVEWHDKRVELPRDVSFTFIDLTEDETAGFISWARSQQATVHGALSAAVLLASASVPPGMSRVGLSSSVDLRSRFSAPEHGCVGQAASVIAASYESTGASGSLARLASSDIRRRFDRGEGEMLLALSGAGRFPVDHTADRVIKDWTEKATPTIFLGNVGMIDGPAPSALKRITPGLAPIPNQVAYVAAATFRNRLSLSVGCDRNRLKITSEELTTAIRSQVMEMAMAGERTAAQQ